MAELLVGLSIGEFLARARAEPVAFLMVRLPLLVVLAWAASAARWPERVLIYLFALAAALAGEAVLQLLLGGIPDPAALLRAAALAALALAVADPLIRHAGRYGGRYGGAAAALVLLIVASVTPLREAATAFVLSGSVRAEDGEGQGTGAPPADRRLAVVTALPIVWGEGDVADMLAGRTGPADIHGLLQRRYAVEPLDRADAAALAPHRLLLVAQPRALDPEELVALDAWVRAGGRALVFVDPALAWPSRWPLGDPRRAPPVTLLDPLLGHWGLDLAAPEQAPGPTVRRIGRARIESEGVGRFTRHPRTCRIEGEGLVADCAIGRGRVLLVADADLLDARQWKGPGARGGTAEQRRADNPVLVLDWLARLSGQDAPASRAIAWIDPARPLALPLGLAFLPSGLLLAGALLLGLRAERPRHRSGRGSDTGSETIAGRENNPRTDLYATVTEGEINDKNSV